MHPDDPEPAVLGAEPGAPAPSGPAWTLVDPLGVYVASLVLALVVGSIWLGATGGRQGELSFGLTVVTLIAQWAGLLGGTVLVSRRRGSGHLGADLQVRITRRDILPGLAAGVASQLVLLPLLYLPVSLLVDDLDISEEARELTGLGTGAGLVLLSVMIVFGAPLVEEIFFRGLLQATLVRRLGPPWGIAAAAVLFGSIHFQPLLLPGLSAFGAVLGILTWRRGRLGPAIVAHIAFNAVTVIALTR